MIDTYPTPDAIAPGPAELAATTPEQVEAEVLSGLPNEKTRLHDAATARDYYELRNEQYIPRRDAEDELDYLTRPKRCLPFARRVVQVLGQHLYCPGPHRQVKGDDRATAWLERVYGQTLANGLWQMADRMATLGGATAFGVAATGDPNRPIRLQLWGADEFAVFPDVGEPSAVVTIERFDLQAQYTLWTADRYRTYRTPKAGAGSALKTAGGILPEPVGPWQPNPYTCLPFAFAHAELPVTTFWQGALGDYLVHANGAADDELSDLAHGIKKFLYPIGVAANCDVEFQPINRFGAFVRLQQVLSDLENLPPATLGYLQAQLDILGAWTHIENALYQALDNLGIPRAAWRMETTQVASGIALICEHLPLIQRAQARREPFRVYETDLARACLAVAGHYYGDAALAARAADLDLILTWPSLQIPIPGPERDQADEWEMATGIKSRVMVAMERYGLTRDQAIDRLKQVKGDNDEAAAIDPDRAAAPAGGAQEPPGSGEPDDGLEQTGSEDDRGRTGDSANADGQIDAEGGPDDEVDSE